MRRLAGVHKVVQLISGVIRFLFLMRDSTFVTPYTDGHTVTRRCCDLSVDSQSPCGWHKGSDIGLQV